MKKTTAAKGQGTGKSRLTGMTMIFFFMLSAVFAANLINMPGLVTVVNAAKAKKETGKESKKARKLRNPRIKKDKSMEAGQKVAWDCIWFGSYPQTEIVDDPAKCVTYGSTYAKESDYLVNKSLYEKLVSSDQWDDQGVLEGKKAKYKRVRILGSGSDSDGEDGQEKADYHYFRFEKIKWRVLKVSKDKAILLSDQVIDAGGYDVYDESLSENALTWERSPMRSWLNGYDSSENSYEIDYSDHSFLGGAFSEKEQNAIVEKAINNENSGPYSKEYGGNNTEDKVFLLSYYEIYKTSTAASYGFCKKSYNVLDEARRSKSSTYAKARGITTMSSTDMEEYDGCCEWSLRSPAGEEGNEAFVYPQGCVLDDTYAVDEDFPGVRPALKIDLSDADLWEYAGTVKSK